MSPSDRLPVLWRALKMRRLSAHRFMLLAWLALLIVACWLPQVARDAPLVPPLPRALLRLDGLSAFFCSLTLLGGAAAWSYGARLRAILPVAALVVLAYTADLLPLTALALGAAALFEKRGTKAEEQGSKRLLSAHAWRGLLASARGAVFSSSRAQHVLSLSPALLLLAAAGLLRQGGSWRVSSELAGAGMGAAPFLLTLAATLLGVTICTAREGVTPTTALVLAPAWGYPLARLYTLGPWNVGWHVAALLLAGTLALWSAARALGEPQPQACRAMLLRATLASGLLALALGSSAGLAAWAYAALVYLVLAAALCDPRPLVGSERSAPARRATLAGVVPLSAPFVATWLGLSACIASAAPVAGVAIWATALLVGVCLVLRPGLARVGWPLVAVNLAAGVLAPLLIELMVMPLVAQLQGGLSPFGELVVWPWVGLSMLDSQRREVAGLPSLLIAGLLGVLMAIVYLLARILAPAGGAADLPAEDAAPDDAATLWARVRRQVFWLDR